jgi:transcriptional regulator with XRE-family HTH domain
MNGELIRRTREAKDLSQAEVAKNAGISQSLLSRLERGERPNATASTLMGLAAVLDLSLDDLVTKPEAATSAA